MPFLILLYFFSKTKLCREVKRVTELKAGVFRIVSSTGKIDAGKTERIKVFCIPTDVHKFEETLLLFITGGNGEDKKGKSFLLTVEGAVPNINLDDFAFVFQEVYVVDTYNNIADAKQVIYSFLR